MLTGLGVVGIQGFGLHQLGLPQAGLPCQDTGPVNVLLALIVWAGVIITARVVSLFGEVGSQAVLCSCGKGK